MPQIAEIVLFYVILSVFFGLGIFSLVQTILVTILGIKSTSWPIADGIIMRSEVVEKETQGYNELPTTSYRPYIDYAYQFGSTQYISNQVSLKNPWTFTLGGKGKATEKVAKYPIGTHTKVFCNPRKQQQSTLAGC